MTAGTARVVKVILRTCAVCGRLLTARIRPDGSYTSGAYFGRIALPKPRRRGKRIQRTAEYWECARCARGG